MEEDIYTSFVDEDPQIEEIYTIILNDGTRIENLHLNGNNFISKTEITKELFDGNLTHVRIQNGEMEDVIENADLVQITRTGDEWWFILREVSEEEIERFRIRADLDFLAMMTDIEI